MYRSLSYLLLMNHWHNSRYILVIVKYSLRARLRTAALYLLQFYFSRMLSTSQQLYTILFSELNAESNGVLQYADMQVENSVWQPPSPSHGRHYKRLVRQALILVL